MVTAHASSGRDQPNREAALEQGGEIERTSSLHQGQSVRVGHLRQRVRSCRVL